MPVRSPLLIEIVGLDGSDAVDARQHAEALRACGPAPRVKVATLASDDAMARRRVAAEAKAAFLEHRPDAVYIAGPAGAAAAVLALLPAIEARWWPSEILDTLTPPSAAGRSILPMGGSTLPVPSLDLATVQPPAPRDRVGLWDGDYVLVPGPLAGDGASRALAAFAAVASDAHGLDLVVLADPQPRYEGEAARLGIATRVHFAGTAPRTAEHTWFASAQAAWFVGGEPVHAGQVMRALAAGCPLLPSGTSQRSRTVYDWLAAHGCLPAPANSVDLGTADRLTAVLDRDPATRHAIERGRAVAEAHSPHAIARILGILGHDEESREVA